MRPERSAPSAVVARRNARMPFSVISRLRSAATRVTVNLRGIRIGRGEEPPSACVPVGGVGLVVA